MVHLWGTNHVHFDALLRFRIFEDELSTLWNTLAKNDHGAGCAHCVSKPLDSLGVIRDVDEHGHLEENALRAAALFSGRLPRRGGAHASHRTGVCVRWGLEIRTGFHRSSPQKSISGATSSTPYSQPSGRWLPFHTIIAALLVWEIRLVSASRRSSSSGCGRTTLHPHWLRIRVCAPTLMRLPFSSSHSRRTGTREFIRRPRRFSWCREPRRLFSRTFACIFASTSSC